MKARQTEARKQIRVLIADDHPVVREGLRTLLSVDPEFEVVGEAADGVEAVREALSSRPDVILLDLVMPRQDGLETISQVKRLLAESRILLLTTFGEDERVLSAIKAGATGCLLKDSSPHELLAAIRDVAAGEVRMHPAITRRLVQELSRPASNTTPEGALTEREREVLSLLAGGLSNQEIAEQLVLSERTVRGHVSRVMHKLQLKSRTQAALYAVRKGLVAKRAG